MIKSETGKKIMILVVAYNAQSTIVEVLDRIPKEIWERAEEIVVADDASQDRTTEIAERYKKDKKKKNLTVVKHKVNKRYGGNQKWGYNYAIEKGYDIVVLVHGDAQYAPEEIPKLVRPIEEDKADFIFGSRMTGNPLKGNMPLHKFFGNKFLTAVENLVLGTRLSEFHSGFRLYSCHALKKIPFNLCSDDYYFDSEIIIQLVMAKQRIGELTIPTRYANEISYVNVINYGLNILRVLGQHSLHKFGIRKYRKFDLENEFSL